MDQGSWPGVCERSDWARFAQMIWLWRGHVTGHRKINSTGKINALPSRLNYPALIHVNGGNWNHCFAGSKCFFWQQSWFCVPSVWRDGLQNRPEEPPIYMSFAYKGGASLIIATCFLPGWLNRGRCPRVYLTLPRCAHPDAECFSPVGMESWRTGFHLSLLVPAEEDEGFPVCTCVTLILHFTSVDI